MRFAKSLWGLMVGLLILSIGLPFNLSNAQETEPVQPYYFGVDLSYVNEMDDCGAVYHENGETQDAFALMAEHGANLVRARLWHNPDWTDYSTLEDVKLTLMRAQEQDMATLLDIHYSDNWADPGRQEIPAAWENLKTTDELVEAVYTYTYAVLMELHANDLTPDFVQVGNETNSGMLKEVVSLDWPRDAQLFNAGIQAVRDFSAETGTSPQIMLHVAQPENTGWWFREATAAGITDFDVIAISYYPQWSTFSIADMGAQVSYLRNQYAKEVMIVETAYPWSREAVDETADNILNQGLRGYPVSPAGQRQFMTDLNQSVISNGGLGTVYWEPAWVSTTCSTRWGQGSHWENATFFDFQNENELHEGIDYMQYPYVYPTVLVDGTIDDTYGEPLFDDEIGDALEDVAAFDLTSLHGTVTDNEIYLAISLAGDIYAERGNYLIYFDTTGDANGAPLDVGNRPITAAEPFYPEYRLDITITEQKGTVSGSYTLNVWINEDWEKLAFTGGVAIHAAETSVIELVIPQTMLNNPKLLNIAVISTDKTRLHTTGDILGKASTPSDWEEAVILDDFMPLDLSN